MSDIIIHNGLADRLREAAQQRNQSIEELIESLLARSVPPETVPSGITAHLGTFAALGEASDRADIRLGVTDVSERTREILETEWPDYLIRRANREPDDAVK